MKEYDIMPGGCYDCDHWRDFNIQGVVKEFKEHGFDVTEDAITHNFSAWRSGLKSGYRDEGNDVFLFTPCGCNDLRFNATHIQPGCEDWQKTYMC